VVGRCPADIGLSPEAVPGLCLAVPGLVVPGLAVPGLVVTGLADVGRCLLAVVGRLPREDEGRS
jgi:hypothetical protein